MLSGLAGNESSEKNGKPRAIGGHKADRSREAGMAGLPEKKSVGG